jgi:hypothetical protein
MYVVEGGSCTCFACRRLHSIELRKWKCDINVESLYCTNIKPYRCLHMTLECFQNPGKRRRACPLHPIRSPLWGTPREMQAGKRQYKGHSSDWRTSLSNFSLRSDLMKNHQQQFLSSPSNKCHPLDFDSVRFSFFLILDCS